jgi:hypothetical protein
MSTISETPDELRARIAISDKAVHGLILQIDRLRALNAELLLALRKVVEVIEFEQQLGRPNFMRGTLEDCRAAIQHSQDNL